VQNVNTCNESLGSCGDNLTEAQGNLAICNTESSECEGDLTTADTSLVTCSEELTDAQFGLEICNANTSVCEGRLTTAQECQDEQRAATEESAQYYASLMYQDITYCQARYDSCTDGLFCAGIFVNCLKNRFTGAAGFMNNSFINLVISNTASRCR